MSGFQEAKKLILDYFEELEKAAPSEVLGVLQKYTVAENYDWKGSYPFRQQNRAEEVANQFWIPLKKALTHMQRRQDIFIAGYNEFNKEELWVMSMGNFMGNFDADFLGIRYNQKIANLRYSEFSCVENGRITKTGLFIDMIGFMIQVGANPLPPQVGTCYVYPGPREHNGLLYDDAPAEKAEITKGILERMLNDTPAFEEVMDCMPHDHLAKHWDEEMLWYGSAGAGYTIPIFQEHQKDFRRNLKDRSFMGHLVKIAEGDFVAFFGWPNLKNTNSGGYLGMTGGDTPATMQVVDIYYCKNGKLSENWVFPDIPFWMSQLGMDVFARTSAILNPQAHSRG